MLNPAQLQSTWTWMSTGVSTIASKEVTKVVVKEVTKAAVKAAKSVK